MKLGEQLKKMRIEHGLTQERFGQFINLAESTISLYESNKRSPDYKTLLKIADYFGVSTDYLLGRTEEEVSGPMLKEVVPRYHYKTTTDPFIEEFLGNFSTMTTEEKELLTEHLLFVMKQIEKDRQKKDKKI